MADFIIAVFTGREGKDSLEGELVEDGADYEDGQDAFRGVVPGTDFVHAD